ncbi:hypothetical protein L6164_000135 [Bauhinia variegata]|uniref:Uncharacterized protein n=1 Tax=Bauhinia variegata TaxID=167791 RepID=A0ACB9Q7X5_BAUVA|nr:hypothetical protein L6164_000135 [Bauhinia variegata]
MGACCSQDIRCTDSEMDDNERQEDNAVSYGEFGARIRLRGSSRLVSMYSQQGKKGVNQDAMTVWENFTGEEKMVFCGVFDGHGPLGHKIGWYARDTLPSKLSHTIKKSQEKVEKYYDVAGKLDSDSNDGDDSKQHQMSLASWESSFLKSFSETDDNISRDINIDSYCSGCTAVTVIKQGDQLMVGNLGDSRAVLCRRGNKGQLIPIQLTVDLKPNIPSEASRIQNCEGRVFAAAEEPEVYRIWMPDEDCPGLAMSRAFGDFCLKDYGLISVPDVFYRKLTKQDEFVVLASDGIWDVLSNTEVIKVVASATKRSLAAKKLVKHAVRAWRNKYPAAKVDDCAVICLFLKDEPHTTDSKPDKTKNHRHEKRNCSNGSKYTNNGNFGSGKPVEEWEAALGGGFSRANAVSQIPQLTRDISRRKSYRYQEGVLVH